MTPRHVHLITPGDHFSPLTGSAIPTVVHGLAGATPAGRERPAVLVARGTYGERYDSAHVIGYDEVPQRRADRVLDVISAPLGKPRLGARRSFVPALREQSTWPDSVILAHNAPQAVPLVRDRHRVALYAHNQLLRTYSRREVQRTLDRVDAIVCVSKYLAEETLRVLPRAIRPRVHVVPNGVEAAMFARPRAPREGQLRIAFLGRVVPDKGVHILLEAVGRLAREDVSVTIIGRPGFTNDAPLTRYERELRRTAAQMHSRVRFASFLTRHELPVALSETDVLVVPSLWPEPFGLTALEGMAAGAAVVASEVGGVPEVVDDAGVLVPPGDAAALADAIEAMAESEEYLGRTQEASYERAREMSWHHARALLDMALKHLS